MIFTLSIGECSHLFYTSCLMFISGTTGVGAELRFLNA